MSITREEAQELILGALQLYAAQHPVPTHVTIAQAAQMLGRSERTIRRRLKRNPFGLIPYEAIVAARTAQ